MMSTNNNKNNDDHPYKQRQATIHNTTNNTMVFSSSLKINNTLQDHHHPNITQTTPTTLHHQPQPQQPQQQQQQQQPTPRIVVLAGPHKTASSSTQKHMTLLAKSNLLGNYVWKPNESGTYKMTAYVSLSRGLLTFEGDQYHNNNDGGGGNSTSTVDNTTDVFDPSGYIQFFDETWNNNRNIVIGAELLGSASVSPMYGRRVVEGLKAVLPTRDGGPGDIHQTTTTTTNTTTITALSQDGREGEGAKRLEDVLTVVLNFRTKRLDHLVSVWGQHNFKAALDVKRKRHDIWDAHKEHKEKNVEKEQEQEQEKDDKARERMGNKKDKKKKKEEKKKIKEENQKKNEERKKWKEFKKKKKEENKKKNEETKKWKEEKKKKKEENNKKNELRKKLKLEKKKQKEEKKQQLKKDKEIQRRRIEEDTTLQIQSFPEWICSMDCTLTEPRLNLNVVNTLGQAAAYRSANYTTVVVDMDGVVRDGGDVAYVPACEILRLPCSGSNAESKSGVVPEIKLKKNMGVRTHPDLGISNATKIEIDNILKRMDCTYEFLVNGKDAEDGYVRVLHRSEGFLGDCERHRGNPLIDARGACLLIQDAVGCGAEVWKNKTVSVEEAGISSVDVAVDIDIAVDADADADAGAGAGAGADAVVASKENYNNGTIDEASPMYSNNTLDDGSVDGWYTALYNNTLSLSPNSSSSSSLLQPGVGQLPDYNMKRLVTPSLKDIWLLSLLMVIGFYFGVRYNYTSMRQRFDVSLPSSAVKKN